VLYVVRRREDVAEICAKSLAATTATTTTTTSAAGAAAAVAKRPVLSSSSVSRKKVVEAPMPSTSAWSVSSKSVSGSSMTPVSLFDECGVSVGSYYCDYCNVFCNSESQLDAHCAATKHKLNVSSDRERQWNYRPPPLTVTDGQYTLCPRSNTSPDSHLLLDFVLFSQRAY